MNTNTADKPETKKARRQRLLQEHYHTCQTLGRELGMSNPDGKKISNSLRSLEYQCNAAATAYCNGEKFQGRIFMQQPIAVDFHADENAWETIKTTAENQIYRIFGTVPDGFFVNGDARGSALKIDNETPEGKALIEACKLHTDWGGYGILSPEITGD